MIIMFIGLTITVGIVVIFIHFLSNMTILGPIVSAVIAAGVTLSITFYTKQTEKDNNRKQLRYALIAELTSLKEVIENRINQCQKLLDEDKPVMTISIHEDYFTVFSTNASRLGLFDHYVAQNIIKTYIDLKGLFDNVRWMSSENEITGEIVNQMLRQECKQFVDSDEYQNLSREFLIRKDYIIKIINDFVLQPANTILVTIDRTLSLLQEEEYSGIKSILHWVSRKKRFIS